MKAETRAVPVLSYLSLFTSLGTLVCCALPSLLVLLGLGASVASALSAAPWLVALSRHKNIVFSVSGAMLALSFLYTYALAPRLRSAADCGTDEADACSRAERVSRWILWFAAAIFLVGGFVAFLLGPILMRTEG